MPWQRQSPSCARTEAKPELIEVSPGKDFSSIAGSF